MAEQADDALPRERRDALAATLGTLFVRGRNRLDDALGEAGLHRYGFDGAPPRTRATSPRGSRAPSSSSARTPPSSTTASASRSRPRPSPRASPSARPAGGGARRAAHRGRENEAAITDRDRAVAEWTLVYQGVATTLIGLYQLAWRADRAERIRPTERRASGQDLAPVEPAAVDPAPVDPAA